MYKKFNINMQMLYIYIQSHHTTKMAKEKLSKNKIQVEHIRHKNT